MWLYVFIFVFSFFVFFGKRKKEMTVLSVLIFFSELEFKYQFYLRLF